MPILKSKIKESLADSFKNNIELEKALSVEFQQSLFVFFSQVKERYSAELQNFNFDLYAEPYPQFNIMFYVLEEDGNCLKTYVCFKNGSKYFYVQDFPFFINVLYLTCRLYVASEDDEQVFGLVSSDDDLNILEYGFIKEIENLRHKWIYISQFTTWEKCLSDKSLSNYFYYSSSEYRNFRPRLCKFNYISKPRSIENLCKNYFHDIVSLDANSLDQIYKNKQFLLVGNKYYNVISDEEDSIVVIKAEINSVFDEYAISVHRWKDYSEFNPNDPNVYKNFDIIGYLSRGNKDLHNYMLSHNHSLLWAKIYGDKITLLGSIFEFYSISEFSNKSFPVEFLFYFR